MGTARDRAFAVESLTGFVVQSIDAARRVEDPFFHLEFDRIFPDNVYAQMLPLMPEASDYRPMHGRSKSNDLADGTHTRVKIDLFPEYIRVLPAEQRGLWDLVGAALCSREVSDAMVRKLAPALARRFGPEYAGVGLYPIPTLTRDGAGYTINIHSDHLSKGITVQFYLPHDSSTTHIGTVFHT